MPFSKKPTQQEKVLIDRFVHAFIISEIGNEVIAKDFPELAGEYQRFMRKRFPHWFRLLDEFQAAVPRVRKQILEEFEREKQKTK